MLTRDFAIVRELARFTLKPTMIQRIGIHSMTQKLATKSRKVWSMAFEELVTVRNPALSGCCKSIWKG